MSIADVFNFDLWVKHFKDEKTFTWWFWKEIKDRDGFWFKIPDDSRGEKPYDAIACLNGQTYHIELKSGKNSTKVDVFTMLRPVQKRSLRKVAECGQNAIVVYYSITHHKYFVIPFEVDTQKIEILLKN